MTNNIDIVFEKEQKELRIKVKKIDIIVAYLTCLTAILFAFGILIIFYAIGEYKPQGLKLNEFGEFLSGTVGITWTLASIILIYIAFLGQRQQILGQTLELKMSKYLFDKQVSDNNLKTRMEIHSKFQAEMRNIQRGFKSDKVNNPNWEPDDNEDRNITIYWYFVFDEWFTCKNGGEILSSLWTDHYRKGAKSALRNEKFREKVMKILEAKNSFLGEGNNFKLELMSIMNEMNE